MRSGNGIRRIGRCSVRLLESGGCTPCRKVTPKRLSTSISLIRTDADPPAHAPRARRRRTELHHHYRWPKRSYLTPIRGGVGRRRAAPVGIVARQKWGVSLPSGGVPRARRSARERPAPVRSRPGRRFFRLSRPPPGLYSRVPPPEHRRMTPRQALPHRRSPRARGPLDRVRRDPRPRPRPVAGGSEDTADRRLGAREPRRGSLRQSRERAALARVPPKGARADAALHLGAPGGLRRRDAPCEPPRRDGAGLPARERLEHGDRLRRGAGAPVRPGTGPLLRATRFRVGTSASPRGSCNRSISRCSAPTCSRKARPARWATPSRRPSTTWSRWNRSSSPSTTRWGASWGPAREPTRTASGAQRCRQRRSG